MDINEVGLSQNQRTVLHWFTIHQNTEAVNFLLEKGANPNAIDSRGWSPLHYAANLGFFEGCFILLSALQINVNMKTPEGETASILASMKGYDQIATSLLEKEQELYFKEKQEDIGSKLKRINDQIRAKIVFKDQEQDVEFKSQQPQDRISEEIAADEYSFMDFSILSRAQKAGDDNEIKIDILYQDRERLLAERLILQKMKEAIDYLHSNELLKFFFNQLQSKLTELFLAYKCLASGSIARSDTALDSIVKKAISLGGSSIPLVGEFVAAIGETVYDTARDSYEGRIHRFISSIYIDHDQITQLIKNIARLTTYKLETQIRQLKDTKTACIFAECIVGYYFDTLRCRDIVTDDPKNSIYGQLALHLFKYEPEGILHYITQTSLELRSEGKLPKWTVRGVLKESGIVTKEGVCFARDQCQIERYGYRLGTSIEAALLQYTGNGQQLHAQHPLHDNPFRYEETVEPSQDILVLTWDELLQNTKNKHSNCVAEIQDITFESKIITLTFQVGTVRTPMLEFAGYIEQQSTQVSDPNIGQLSRCDAPKDTPMVRLYLESEISAELLAKKIQECWFLEITLGSQPMLNSFPPPKSVTPDIIADATPESGRNPIARNRKKSCCVLQ